jgi:hypothetical protein
MEEVNSYMLMEMCLKVNGKKIKQMVKEFINIKMEQNMKECGKMIYNTDMELKHELTAQNIKEIIMNAKNMGKELIIIMMDQSILETGKIIILQAMSIFYKLKFDFIRDIMNG